MKISHENTTLRPDRVEEHCGNCRFFVQGTGHARFGLCKRFPPAAFPEEASRRPLVKNHDVCGEHEYVGEDFTAEEIVAVRRVVERAVEFVAYPELGKRGQSPPITLRSHEREALTAWLRKIAG